MANIASVLVCGTLLGLGGFLFMLWVRSPGPPKPDMTNRELEHGLGHYLVMLVLCIVVIVIVGTWAMTLTPGGQ